MGRHSIFLDQRTETKLDFVLSKENTTKSELLRKAIALYYEIFCIDSPVDPDKIKTYAMLLCKGEHLIVDVAHWELFMGLSDHFDNLFWKELHKIGKEHGEQWSNKVDFFGFLKLLEFCNWFTVAKMDDKKFVLVPKTENSMDFVAGFIEGVAEGYELPIRISKLKGKLIVYSD